MKRLLSILLIIALLPVCCSAENSIEQELKNLVKEYLSQNEKETPRVVSDIVAIWNDNGIKITLPEKELGSRSNKEKGYDRYIIAEGSSQNDDFEIIYSIQYDGSRDSLSIWIPTAYKHMRKAFACVISYYTGMNMANAYNTYDNLQKNIYHYDSHIDIDNIAVYLTDLSDIEVLQVERKVAITNTTSDKFDYDEAVAAIERQEELNKGFKSVANNRIREYWEVKIDNFMLTYNDKSESVTITMYLTWNVNNGKDMAKKMLEMYSDDMAATLKEAYPDISISRLCLLWTNPYISKKWTAAKYFYTSYGSKIYRTGAYGLLYGKE